MRNAKGKTILSIFKKGARFGHLYGTSSRPTPLELKKFPGCCGVALLKMVVRMSPLIPLSFRQVSAVGPSQQRNDAISLKLV